MHYIVASDLVPGLAHDTLSVDLDELCTPTAFAPYYDCIDELHDTLVSITQRILLSFQNTPAIIPPVSTVPATAAAAEDERAGAERIDITRSTMADASFSTDEMVYNIHYFLSEPTSQSLIEQLCGPDVLHTTSFLPTLYDLLFTDKSGNPVSDGSKGVYEAHRPVGDSVNHVSIAQQWFLAYLRSTLLSSLTVGCSPAHASADKRHSFERSISVLDTVMELCDCHCYHLLARTPSLDSTDLDTPNSSTAPIDSICDPAGADIPYTLLSLYPSPSSMIASQATVRLGLGQHMITTWSEDQQLEWRTQWWAAIHKLLILHTDYQSTDPHTQTKTTLYTPVLSDLFKQQMMSLMLSELHSIYRDILRLQPQQHQLKGKKKQGKQNSNSKPLSHSNSNDNDNDSKIQELYAFLPSVFETSLVYITTFKQWIIDTLVHTIYSRKGHNSDSSRNMLLLSIQVSLYILKSITRDIVYDEEAEVIDIEKEYLTHWMDVLYECSIQYTIQYTSSSINSTNGVQENDAVAAEKPVRLPDDKSIYDKYVVKYNLLCKRYKEYMT